MGIVVALVVSGLILGASMLTFVYAHPLGAREISGMSQLETPRGLFPVKESSPPNANTAKTGNGAK